MVRDPTRILKDGFFQYSQDNDVKAFKQVLDKVWEVSDHPDLDHGWARLRYMAKAKIGGYYWIHKYYEEAFDVLFSLIGHEHSIPDILRKELSQVMTERQQRLTPFSEPSLGLTPNENMKEMAIHQIILRLTETTIPMKLNRELLEFAGMAEEWVERWKKISWISDF